MVNKSAWGESSDLTLIPPKSKTKVVEKSKRKGMAAGKTKSNAHWGSLWAVLLSAMVFASEAPDQDHCKEKNYIVRTITWRNFSIKHREKQSRLSDTQGGPARRRGVLSRAARQPRTRENLSRFDRTSMTVRTDNGFLSKSLKYTFSDRN